MKQYYFHDGQSQQGPLDFEQLKNSKLTRDNLVWCEGMETWKVAGEMEELKSLFAAVPPPLPGNIKTPPPLTPEIPAATYTGKSKKKALIWIIIGASLGALLITALVIFLMFKSCSNSKNSTPTEDSIAVQAEAADDDVEATKAAGTTKEKKSVNSNSNNELSEAERKENEQKEAYRRNWSKHVYARANYDFGPFGIVINPTVTVTNSMPYTVNEVSVWLNYMLSTGSTWKSEKVTFYNVSPNSSATKNAPPTDRGSSIQTRIGKVSCNAIGLYSSN